MEFLDGGAIKPLKSHLKKYNDDPDREVLRLNVEAEVRRLIELADANRTKEAAGNSEKEEMKVSELPDSGSKHGYLGWLSKLTNLSDPANGDIYNLKYVPPPAEITGRLERRKYDDDAGTLKVSALNRNSW